MNSLQGRVLVSGIRRGGLYLKVVNLVLRCDFFSSEVGANLYVPHVLGIVVHSRVIIGANVTIFHGVTLGELAPDGPVPTVGDDVLIGAGAVILGGVVVGKGARIGANAVVLCSVPAGASAIGVPARIVTMG